MAFLIGGANSAADTGYDIDNSCRFNDGDSPYLHITPSAGNRKTWTWSVWIKIGVPGVIIKNGLSLALNRQELSISYPETAELAPPTKNAIY